ncbi:MAG TPA: c-type cytochrome [Rhodocyclaceae bacterium]
MRSPACRALRVAACLLAALPVAVSARESFRPPPLESAPADKYGALVLLGYRIVTDTPGNAARYAGNALSCTHCHVDAGRRPNAAPLWAAYVAYPRWRAKDDRVSTFEERVQQCFRFSLDGIPPALGSIELQAITSYAHYLATGAPVGAELAGRGFPELAKTGQDPNPDRGRLVYQNRCSACHGGDGAGKPGIPPVWGGRSYNKGAGMANVRIAASFIKANMPRGNPNLTDQEALDVSAYINLQYRPHDPRKGLLGILQ